MRNLKNTFFFLLFIALSSCESPLLQTIKERPPNAPVFSNNSTKDDVGPDWVILKWKPVDNASEYRVYYKPVNIDEWKSISCGNELNIKVTDLKPNTRYSFYITAVNDTGGESEKSHEIIICTKLKTPDIEVEILNHYSVKIKWAPVDGAEYYAVYYSDNNSGLNEPKKWQIEETSCIINTLKENTNFNFQVQAYSGPSWLDKKNYSDLSVKKNGLTQLSIPVLFIDENLTTSSSIYMHWGAVSGANSYEIQYSVYSGELRWQNGKTINVTTCTITELEPNTLYTFKIRALNSSGKTSLFSEGTRAYRTRMEPPSVLAKEVTPEKITLEWSNKNSWDYTYHTFKYGTSQNAYSPSITTVQNTYTFNSLRENTLYYFSIFAYDLSGNAGKVKLFSCFTLLSKPENLAVTSVDENIVSLSWNEKSGADGYIVEVYDSSSSLVRKTQLGNIIRDTRYSVGGLSPNTLYSFAVKAVNEDAIGVNAADHIEGEPSDMVSALTMLTLPQPVILRQFVRSIELSWQPAAGADFYKIFYSKNDSFGTAVQYESGQAITGRGCTVQGLDTDTVYYFWVQAFNNNGNYSRLSPSIKGNTITSNINIIFDFSNPADPALQGMPENIIQTSRDSYTITVKTGAAGWDKTEWYLYGVIEKHTVGNSFTIDWQLPVGPYELTVVVTKNNIPYSVSAQFKVLNTEEY